jgi:hypothetical protein
MCGRTEERHVWGTRGLQDSVHADYSALAL